MPDYPLLLGKYKKPALEPEEESVRKIWSGARHELEPRRREIGRLLGKKKEMTEIGGGWPDVEKPKLPASLYPEMSHSIAPGVGRLQRIDPEILRSLGPISSGPNKTVSERLARDREIGGNFYPEDFWRTNLLGTTNLSEDPSSIALNPRLKDNAGLESLLPVLGHEMTHAVGHGGEEKPEEVQGLISKLLGRKRNAR